MLPEVLELDWSGDRRSTNCREAGSELLPGPYVLWSAKVFEVFDECRRANGPPCVGHIQYPGTGGCQSGDDFSDRYEKVASTVSELFQPYHVRRGRRRALS